MKGQINIEFLAAAGLFIIALVTLVTSSQVLPSYSSEMDRISLQMEAETLSDELIREEGLHSYGVTGENWEKNLSTIESAEAIGFARENHVLERSKIRALKTTTVNGAEKLNYSKFRDVTGATNQYHLKFIWLPTVETFKSFTKGSPPSDPPIVEPDTQEYRDADNTVHYGSIDLEGSQYNVLVTSHNGVYDSLYVTEGAWIFTSSYLNSDEPYGLGDRIRENGFYVERFQNREDNTGSVMIWRKELKEFGPSVARNTEVITLDRFAVLEGEPLRMEVSTW